MLKAPLVLLVLVGHLLHATLLLLLRVSPHTLARTAGFYARAVLRILGVEVKIEGAVPKAGVIVANHLSYVDILVLLGYSPCRFVTFTEMGDVPGVGLLTKLLQSLLIHRSSPGRIRQDIAAFERELKRGSLMCFFPEGSSFDGTHVRPFKTPLFEAVTRTGLPVTPACFNYRSIDGAALGLGNRDRLFYHGDMQLLPQLLGLLKLQRVEVDLKFGAPLASGGQDRKLLAQAAFAFIQAHYRPVVAP